MARKGRIKSNPSPPPRHLWQSRGRISQPRSLALGFLLAQRSTPPHPAPPSCRPRVSVRKKILRNIYFRRGSAPWELSSPPWELSSTAWEVSSTASIFGGAAEGKNGMLRKKCHVVRKKFYVVRKNFYVASIFDYFYPLKTLQYIRPFLAMASLKAYQLWRCSFGLTKRCVAIRCKEAG